MYQHLDDNELLAEIDVITRERDNLDRIARSGRYDSQDAARKARIVGQQLIGLHIERQQRGLEAAA